MLESPASGSLAPPKSKPSSPSKVFCLEGIGGIFRSLEIDGVRSGGCGFSESLGGVDIVHGFSSGLHLRHRYKTEMEVWVGRLNIREGGGGVGVGELEGRDFRGKAGV